MSYEQTITALVILKNNTTIYQCNKETVNLKSKKGGTKKNWEENKHSF